MATEWYKCGLSDILQMSCKGPYATKEEADKDRSLYWTVQPTTLSVFKYQPAITKSLCLHFKHTYATTGTFISKPN
jgi:hypothetical protein